MTMNTKETKPGPEEQLRHFSAAYWEMKKKYLNEKARADESEDLLERLSSAVLSDVQHLMPNPTMRALRKLARQAEYHLKLNRKIERNG